MVFNRDSISDIKKRVRRNEKMLQEIAENTRYLRKTHGVEAPASILGTDEASESIFSQLVDPKPDEKASFETVILNTKVYSNAFSGVLSLTANDDESDDARTVLDSETVDLPLRVDDRATSNTTGIGIDSPELRRPVQTLGVTRIVAYCLNEYTAQLDGEFSFKKSDTIFDLQRFSRSRYRGLHANSGGTVGQFDREKVNLNFALRHPLEVRIVETFKSSHRDIASYSKGEIFTVNVS
jgi:hypothetical protein